MPTRKKEKDFDRVLETVRKGLNIPVGNESELDSEPFVINEQKKRDIQTTKILAAYVKDYQYRTDKNRKYRSVLFWGCSSMTFVIILACVVLLALWVPMIIGQYETPATGREQAQDTGDGPVDFQQIVDKVDEMINTVTDSTDYAVLAGAIKEMVDIPAKDEEINVSQTDMSVKNVVSLITVCLTLLAAIIGLLKIIAQYVFQTNEQANVNDIVKSLQENDYNYKKAVLQANCGLEITGSNTQNQTSTQNKKNTQKQQNTAIP